MYDSLIAVFYFVCAFGFHPVTANTAEHVSGKSERESATSPSDVPFRVRGVQSFMNMNSPVLSVQAPPGAVSGV
jgi:hypothetical protein